MFRRPTAPWRKVIPNLQTGDLIFFKGHGWFSKGVELLTGGVWSHVAMIIEAKDIYPDMPADQLLLWESTTYPGHSVDNDPSHIDMQEGVMLVDLEKRLREYFDHWNYKQLSARYLHVDRTEGFRQGIAEFVLDPEIRAAEYPNFSPLLWYYLRERYLTARADKTFFCSELVAATYQAAGLLPEAPSCTSYCPRDFSENGFVPRLMRAEFGQEVYMGPQD